MLKHSWTDYIKNIAENLLGPFGSYSYCDMTHLEPVECCQIFACGNFLNAKKSHLFLLIVKVLNAHNQLNLPIGSVLDSKLWML